MSWKYVGRGSFIPGVESRDYTDAEFDAAAKQYEEINSFPAGSLAASLLWEHTDDKPQTKAARAAGSEGE